MINFLSRENMKIITQNKKARFNFEIIETLEAGIKLIGVEVKAIRNHLISIDEAWVKIEGNYVYLINSSVSPDKIPEWQSYDPRRQRVLLIKKSQIRKLKNFVLTGLTIVPLKFYFNTRNIIKVEIGVAKGKKLHDKRKTIMERDIKRHGY